MTAVGNVAIKKVPLRAFPEKDVIKTRFILNLYL